MVRPTDGETTNGNADMAFLMMDKDIIVPLGFDPIPAFPCEGKGKMMAAGFNPSKYVLDLHP